MSGPSCRLASTMTTSQWSWITLSGLTCCVCCPAASQRSCSAWLTPSAPSSPSGLHMARRVSGQPGQSQSSSSSRSNTPIMTSLHRAVAKGHMATRHMRLPLEDACLCGGRKRKLLVPRLRIHLPGYCHMLTSKRCNVGYKLIR